MQTEYPDNGRPESDEDNELKLLFRRSAPPFASVDVSIVAREAAMGSHDIVADTRAVGGYLKAGSRVAPDAGGSGSLSQGRAIMLKRMGVMGVCAASICMALAWGLWGGNSVLAQVQDAIRNVRTATYTVTHTTGAKQEITWVVKVLGEDLCRVEQPDGIYLIFDVKGKKIMEVNPNESKVRITENLPVPGNFNIIATLSSVKDSAVKHQPGPPNREIEGKVATGIVIEENGVQFNVWIDPATNLPLEMQRHGAPPQKNASQAAETWSNFRFDEPLDKSLFAFEVPAGFAIDTRQSVSSRKGTSESYGFGPERRKP